MTDSKRWLIVISLVIFAALIYQLEPILTPFTLSLLLAYLLDPVVGKLASWTKSRTISTVIVLSIFFIIATITMLILLPVLEKQLVHFINFVPQLIDWLSHIAIPWLEAKLNLNIPQVQPEHIKELLVSNWSQAGTWLKKVLLLLTNSGITVVGWLMNLILIPIVMFYFLRDWNPLLANIKYYFPNRYKLTMTTLIKQCDDVLSLFIRGQLLVMLCLGLIYSLGLTIAGINMGVLIGLTAGLLSIVPYLGTIIGISLGILLALIQYASLWAVFKVGLVFGVGQLIESTFLTPVLIGDKIGLHPIAVIFAILAGGQLFGFVGTLLALPVAAVVTVFVRYASECYLDSHFYQVQK